MSMNTLSEDMANMVYDILVEHAGANESMREEFVHYLGQEVGVPGHEFRFYGVLGNGGKLKFQRSTFSPNLFVCCYPEDETPERLVVIDRTNSVLKAMDYLVKVAEERELTEEDLETVIHIRDAHKTDDFNETAQINPNIIDIEIIED